MFNLEQLEIQAVIQVLMDNNSSTGYVLEASKDSIPFLNECCYIDFYAEKMVFFCHPAQNGLRIFAEKTDEYGNTFLIEKAHQQENRWHSMIRGEEVSWTFRLSKHFNLSPGDRIILAYIR